MNVKIKIKIESKRIRPKLSEVERLKCNNNKIKKTLNWKPKVSFENGIKKVIEWMNQDEIKKIYKEKNYNI